MKASFAKLATAGACAVGVALVAGCGGGGGGTPPATGSNAPAPAPTTLESATKLAAAFDALISTAIPATGEAFQIKSDSCYLDNGETKAMKVAEFDADVALAKASNAFRVGSTRTNVRVIAERSLTNADGSTRQEADILYDIAYTDGSVDKDAWNRMITGSSSGSCATPTNSTEWRYFGNQRLFGVNVQGRNIRDERYLLATGQPHATPFTYRREVQFSMRDPQGLATYAVITGPGNANINGVVTPLSFKVLSPRILQNDPLLAGKNGNFSNWKPGDSFRLCRNPAITNGSSATWVPASTVDCSAGASDDHWGVTLNVPAAGVSAATLATHDGYFDGIGFVAGGVYTFTIYNDDGWKTVNGHAGKTPIATYTSTLEKLPYTFAEMSPNADVTTDRFARLTATSITPVQGAAAIKSATSSTMSMTWVAPVAQADGRVFRLGELGEYFNGAKATNTLGAIWPAEYYYTPMHPGGAATTFGTVGITGVPSTIARKSYAEFSLFYTDRDNSRLVSIYSFR